MEAGKYLGDKAPLLDLCTGTAHGGFFSAHQEEHIVCDRSCPVSDQRKFIFEMLACAICSSLCHPVKLSKKLEIIDISFIHAFNGYMSASLMRSQGQRKGSIQRSTGSFLIIGLLTAFTRGMAAIYYVDFEEGSDENTGLSPTAPFQRAPGDPKARGKAAVVRLLPGDVIRLKGGVVYRGRICLTVSGLPDQPITIDGHSEGSFGEGRAILDGSQPVREWRQCASPDEARGNPNWRELYYTDLPGPLNWQDVHLTTAEVILSVAQAPKPSDPFFRNRPAEFFKTDHRLASALPVRLLFEAGTHGNRQAPLSGLLTGTPAVIEPIAGGAISLEWNTPMKIAAVGLQSARPVHIREYAILADGKELVRAEMPDEADRRLIRHEFPPTDIRKITIRLLSARDGVVQRWTRLSRLMVFTPEGENILGGKNLEMFIEDHVNLTATDPRYYDGMTVGFHAGNNFVFYRPVRRFNPSAHRLYFDFYEGATYAQTSYALFNSVKLISQPGEYSFESTTDPKVTRLFFRPSSFSNGSLFDVGLSAEPFGVEVRGAAHVVVRGLLVRRQGGRSAAGIIVQDARHVRIEDCMVRLVNGVGIQTTGAEDVVVENCRSDHNRDRGIFHRNGRNISTLNCRLERNGSTALGHYTVVGGICAGNEVKGHKGNHANGLTFYLGCRDMIIERNEVYDGNIGLTMQEAENMIIRNNILDGGGRGTVVGIWTATPFRNVRFLNNTIVGGPRNSTWAAAVFSNNPRPEGLVFRNNIIDGLAGNLPAVYENNLYTSWGPNQKDRRLGPGELYEADLSRIFVDPGKRDYRLKPGSPAMGAGRPLDEVVDDFTGQPRPRNRVPDLGAYSSRE